MYIQVYVTSKWLAFYVMSHVFALRRHLIIVIFAKPDDYRSSCWKQASFGISWGCPSKTDARTFQSLPTVALEKYSLSYPIHTALRKHASRHESFVRIDCNVGDASTWLCIIPYTRQHTQQLKSVYQILSIHREIHMIYMIVYVFFLNLVTYFPFSCATKWVS